jgi:large conductance mechanosensitive channel
MDAKAIRKTERAILADFKDFLLKQKALALAVAVIVGAAIGKVVSSIVEDLINPLIGLLLPGGDWRNARIVLGSGIDPKTGKPLESAITYGHLLGSIVDFLVIAIVVYMLTNILLPKPHEEKPATKECSQCKEIIPIEAVRCRACTQPVGP